MSITINKADRRGRGILRHMLLCLLRHLNDLVASKYPETPKPYLSWMISTNFP
jgi:hypothetical protein